jgi:hypothetical protein
MSYTPQPGTVAAKALAHLQALEAGSELSTAVLSEAVDCDPAGLPAFLLPAVNAGLVRRRRRDGFGRMLWWRLGNGEDPLPHRNVAPDVKPKPGEMFPGVRGDEPVDVERLIDRDAVQHGLEPRGGRPMTLRECAEAEEKVLPRPFDAWLSGVSGELVLQGVAVDAEGDVVLGLEQTDALRRLLLGRMPA